MGEEFAGRGLTFPMQLGSAGLAESTGLAKVEQSIRIILGTQPGERVMRPDFGSRLRDLAFAPNTPATADLARYFVTESLTRWEPRIELLEVEVTNDPTLGLLLIQIRYRLRATGGVQALVYPFPLEHAR
ncbi:GPW/gp25 family protein [Micromonospora sp. NPDC005299]|uniref:GPW/gp25 family protein n=1 Tax=Micromonospora sp. NPDC005299 TaxID=3364231 RepID=UPI0036A9CE6D